MKHRDRIRQELERLEIKIRTHRPTPARLAELERLRAIVRNEVAGKASTSLRYAGSAKKPAAPNLDAGRRAS